MRYHFLGRARDNYGNILPNIDVSVYLAGTTTPIKVWNAQTGGTSTSTVPQTITNTSGQFNFYVDDTEYSVDIRVDIIVGDTTYSSMVVFIGAGTSGTSGTSGVSGTSGTSGVSGTSGTSGVSGTSGSSGSSGTSGVVTSKLLQYTGNDAASQSITGAGFTPKHVSIYLGAGPLIFKSDDPYTSKMWDDAIPGWRSTMDGEHLSLDADGFTVSQHVANGDTFIYTALCFA